MTQEQIRRINQAKKETQRVLDRALSYRPQFRNNKLISEYNEHLNKLNQMLCVKE